MKKELDKILDNFFKQRIDLFYARDRGERIFDDDLPNIYKEATEAIMKLVKECVPNRLRIRDTKLALKQGIYLLKHLTVALQGSLVSLAEKHYLVWQNRQQRILLGK